MKKTNFLKKCIPFMLTLCCCITLVTTTHGQTESAILQQNGTSYFFAGTDSFITALDAAQTGDTIYLSAGTFEGPEGVDKGIDKGVVIIGAGHFPDEGNFKKRTTINASQLYINAGADNLHLEGLYISKTLPFDGSIVFQEDASINHVTIKRCRVGYNIYFRSKTELTSKNNCIVEECYISGGIQQGQSNFGGGGYLPVANNLQIVKNVIGSNSITIVVNALISGNILLCTSSFLYNVENSTFNDNIFVSSDPNVVLGDYCSNNIFENNIFTKENISFGDNIAQNNYLGIPQESIFINQTGITIDYSHDYHLKNPSLYLGTDGTQVGLYGGVYPFKDFGYPFNPQVVQKNIGTEVLPDGTLPIRIKVQAQDR